MDAPGAIRTRDLRIRNPSLYPTELQARNKYKKFYSPFYGLDSGFRRNDGKGNS